MTAPYVKFGQVVHSLRRTYHVTTKELCGALELSSEFLVRLEKGAERPSEDLVEQLISHFELDDNLANNLWILAGYPIEKIEDIAVQTAYMPAGELKATYTDLLHVSVNNYGVVLNFMQNIGPNNQPFVVSRLGMSKEHAQSVVDVLSRTLAASDGQQHVEHPPLGLSTGDTQ